ncbi:MAG TPA: diguanylate cyclase [Burkholderiales bacterium]|nr:diguanylate cyclase [Burkholderiales bacterium]
MAGTYNTWLVILSIVVAVIASYVALDLASRIAASTGSKTARYWLAGGALSMGTGIWSMHFIGMLAFRLPIPMSYDIPITLLSLLIAVIVSGFALFTVSHGTLSMRRLLGAGLLMGIGIASMHYTGMAAMQMKPPIRYDSFLFSLSILIAMAASLAALWIAFQLRSETILSAFWKKAGSALVMGAAISGMHYTGMAAAIIAPNSICTVSPQDINNVWLAGAIGGFTFMFLTTTLLISVFDARLADRSAKLAETLRRANVVLETRSAELSRANALLQQEMQERMQVENALRESEERYRQLVELSPDAILIQSEGRFTFVNSACVKLLGAATPDELIGKPVLDIVHPDYLETVVERMRQIREENRTVPPLEEKMLRLDGKAVDVEVTASPFTYKGKPGAQVVMRDITRRKRAEEEIRSTQTFLSSIVDNIPNMIFVKDAKDLKFVRLNKAGEQLTGYSEKELLGKSDYDFFPKEQADFFTGKDRETLRIGKHVFIVEEPIKTKDGTKKILQTKKMPILDENGNPQYLLGISEDITERKKAEEQLTYLAQYDSLTGLPNRNLFRDRLSLTMARAKRDGKMLALMFLDLDRFKEINDTLGHTIGDEVLQATAGLLRESLRDVDTIARLGGDEFTIILENITHEDQVTTVAEKIRKAFADSIVIQGREIFVTASIGITLYPRDAEDIDALLQTADIAMYRAKEEGRNTHEFYAHEMNAQAAERLDMENLLRYAIDRQELLLHYQPQVEIKSGEIVGTEALIRWNSKELVSFRQPGLSRWRRKPG